MSSIASLCTVQSRDDGCNDDVCNDVALSVADADYFHREELIDSQVVLVATAAAALLLLTLLFVLIVFKIRKRDELGSQGGKRRSKPAVQPSDVAPEQRKKCGKYHHTQASQSAAASKTQSPAHTGCDMVGNPCEAVGGPYAYAYDQSSTFQASEATGGLDEDDGGFGEACGPNNPDVIPTKRGEAYGKRRRAAGGLIVNVVTF